VCAEWHCCKNVFKDVLWTEDVQNILNAMGRRGDNYKTTHSVDIKEGKHSLVCNQQLKLFVWAWKNGSTNHFQNSNLE
jgi:hypothetical protein